MIIFVNSFALKASAGEFESVFAESADFLCAQPGFISHRLVRSTENPAHYLNIALWEDEDALRAATGLPDFREHRRRLRERATTDPQVFESVVERSS